MIVLTSLFVPFTPPYGEAKDAVTSAALLLKSALTTTRKQLHSLKELRGGAGLCQKKGLHSPHCLTHTLKDLHKFTPNGLGETLEGFCTWSQSPALVLGSMSQREHPNLPSNQLRMASLLAHPPAPLPGKPTLRLRLLVLPPLLSSPPNTGDGQTTDLQTNPGLLGIWTASFSSLHLSDLCLHQQVGKKSRAKMNGFSVIRVYCVPSPNTPHTQTHRLFHMRSVSHLTLIVLTCIFSTALEQTLLVFVYSLS